ncbi:MAG TPA: hypothetical protein VGN23_07395 [Verrucomicrobiae bacterium]|jgi:hypothetical protein
MKNLSLTPLVLFLSALCFSSAPAQGTAFTYQGHLIFNNAPANGNYDMQFGLCPNSTGNTVIAGPVTNSAVAVTNGTFTTAIDFGAGAFTGGTNWLDIAVRTNATGSFNELSPRQQILPVPYAIYSSSAGTAATANSANTAATAIIAVTASNLASGSISGSSIAPGSLTAADFAPGQIVTNLNGLTGGITLVGTNKLTLTASGNTLTIGQGDDSLFVYYSGQTLTVSSPYIIPINTISIRNGWGYNNNATSPEFTVPATGYYLIHFDALPSTANPEIGVYAGPSLTLIPGSLGLGSTVSHSFVAYLTANESLAVASAGGTIQFESTYSAATLFSLSIVRLN